MKLAKVIDKVLDECGLEVGSFNYKSDTVKAIFDEIHNPETKANLFPYKYFCYESGIFINENNSGGFVIEAAPQVGVNNKNLEQMEGYLRDQLPQGTFLQFLLVASPRVDHIIDRFASKLKPINSEQQEFFKRRLEYLRKIAKREINTKLRVRDFRLFISFSCKNKNEQELIEQASIVKKHMEGLLESMSIPMVSVDPQGLINLVDELVHPAAEDMKHYDPSIPINIQIPRRDNTFIHLKDKILQGDLFTQSRCFTVIDFPKGSIQAGSVAMLLGDQTNDNLNLSCTFSLCYTITPNVSDSRKQQLIAKGNGVIKTADSWFGRRDIRLQEMAQEWGEVIKSLNGGQRVFTDCFQILITDKSDNIDKSEQILRSIFSANRWKLIKETFAQLPSFLGMLPMMPATGLWDQYKYFNFLTTSMLDKVTCLLPIYAEWKGTENQAILLGSRKGQLFGFNFFEPRKNYNVIVVAPSGGGKSVCMQEFTYYLLAQNTRVFILDIGRSYQKICNIVGGDFVEFRMDTGFSLNLFSNIPDNEYTDNFLDYAKRIVCLMASPSGNITDLERSIIEACLNVTWKKYKQNTTITLLCEELNMEGSLEARTLARMLYPFTKNGSYGKFFESKAKIDFTNPFVVIEFEEIADREDLLAVVMQIVSTRIVQMFSGDRSQPLILVIDEYWKTKKKFAPLVERFVRTFRKYGFSLVLVTQSYMDFVDSDIGKTIWDNCQWHLFLAHDTEAVNTLRKTGDFDEGFLRLLETVRMVPGQYSEILISSSQETVVGRLMLDKYSQELYSTKAENYTKITQLMKSGLSVVEALEQIVQ